MSGHDPMLPQSKSLYTRTLRHLSWLMYLPWLLLLVWLVSVAWFMCDDAFISFRYVRNLVEGHGLVFNPGEFVEGYTNFLWVLELAGLWKVFGFRPEHAAPTLSVLYTIGTIAVMLGWVANSAPEQTRGRVGWIALGLLCSSATFAVWTSSGLETRQFTFFIVAAIVCLTLRRVGRLGLGLASLCLAAAAYTRPEGLMLAACCFAYFVGHKVLTQKRIDSRDLLILVGPFVFFVAVHFLFRYSYYGEWLPNTYYAKHIRPWYESGFRYLGAATLETGLYLLLPLAVLGMRWRWQRHNDGIHALSLLCIGAHMAYLLRIGGDHFEFRPLDFYWPLLAIAAAEGLTGLGTWLSVRLKRLRSCRRLNARVCTVGLFVPVLFYASALQGSLLLEGAAKNNRTDTFGLHIELNEENAEYLLAAPGMPMLVAISNDLRKQCAAQLVGARFVEHREFGRSQRDSWSRYENAPRGIIPEDALMAWGTVGIMPFYAPDLKIVDTLGLVDATIARTDVVHPNAQRVIAHDRKPPPNYLQERNVNFFLHGSETTEARALKRANYTIKVGAALWMPFDVADHTWANLRFADHDLQARHQFSQTDPADNRFYSGGKHYVGERFLGRFEDGMDGWTIHDGDAIANHKEHPLYQNQSPVFGHVGPGFLTSFHPSKGDTATGRITSPEFTARADQRLAFVLGGGSHPKVGLKLLVNGKRKMKWKGHNSETLKTVVFPLKRFAGKRLQLELYDNTDGSWGHIALDHVMLVGPK